MSRETPRQPKDMQGLLKFCLEATRDEDAPPIPDNPEGVLDSMDPEKRQWLQEALEGMSVDVIQQLTNGMKILTSNSYDLEDKEEALDLLEDWLGNIDHAINFHKIGGFTVLKGCLSSPHAPIRTGAAHLFAEITQNNAYCQDKLLKDDVLDLLLNMLDNDTDETCRVKALYAVSCVCRDCPAALARLDSLDGWSTVLRAIQSDVPRLRTKGCFFLAAVASSAPATSSGGSVDPSQQRVADRLAGMGLVTQLAAILHQPLDLTHEHVLNAMLALVSRSEVARADAHEPQLQLQPTLKRRLEEARGKEEYLESVEHINQLMHMCFREEVEDVADR